MDMARPADSDRKRAALRYFMKLRDLKPKTWAEHARISPNTLYNFLNGHSQKLDQETYEKLAAAEKVPVFAINGTMTITKPPVIINVRGRVKAGEWDKSNLWVEAHVYAVAHMIEETYQSSVFGLEVQGDSMDMSYPDGSVVFCVPIADFQDELATGNKVVSQITRADGLSEVTVKELVIGDDGAAWLWPRSTNPHYQSPIEWDRGNAREVSVLAVVVASYRNELRR